MRKQQNLNRSSFFDNEGPSSIREQQKHSFNACADTNTVMYNTILYNNVWQKEVHIQTAISILNNLVPPPPFHMRVCAVNLMHDLGMLKRT